MRLIINLALSAVIIGLIYFLAMTIYEPINFNDEKAMREKAVIAQLEDVRTAQMAYLGIKKQYTDNFDSLKHVLSNDSFKMVKIFGNPDEEDAEITQEIVMVPAIDSIQKLGLNLDSLRYIPYADGKEFKIVTDVITYQSIKVPVLEVKTKIADYMGKFADPKYKKYDNKYDPDMTRKFGDLTRPSTGGNWE